MFITITWVFVGLVAGGMLGGELADLSANHRGDIGALLGGGLMGAMLGAVGGGWLGLTLTRKFAGDKRKLDMLAGGTWIGIGFLVLGTIMFEMIRESSQ